MFEADFLATPPYPGNLAAGRRPAMGINATPSPSIDGLSTSTWCRAALALPPATPVTPENAAAGPPASALPLHRTLLQTVLLVTMLSQGTPMLNCADIADAATARFVADLWALRRRLALLMQPPQFDSLRDLAWTDALGDTPAWGGSDKPNSAYLALCIRSGPSAVYLGVNPARTGVSAVLPPPPRGTQWRVAAYTGAAGAEAVPACDGAGPASSVARTFALAPKASVCLESVPLPRRQRASGGPASALRSVGL